MSFGVGTWVAVGVAATVVAAAGIVGYLAAGGSDGPSRSSEFPSGSSERIPAAWIDRPAHGEVLPLGVFVVNSHATAVDGITSMTMEVNGERQVEPRSGASLEHVDWSFEATTPGTYTIEVWGTTENGVETPPSIATVLVVDAEKPEPSENEVPAATQTATPSPRPPRRQARRRHRLRR